MGGHIYVWHYNMHHRWFLSACWMPLCPTLRSGNLHQYNHGYVFSNWLTCRKLHSNPNNSEVSESPLSTDEFQTERKYNACIVLSRERYISNKLVATRDVHAYENQKRGCSPCLQFMCHSTIGSLIVYCPRKRRPTRRRSMCCGCSCDNASRT